MNDIYDRVNHLETSARRWRISTMVLGAAITGSLLLGLTSGAMKDYLRVKTLSCEELIVSKVDGYGSIHLSIDNTEGGATLILMSSDHDDPNTVHLNVRDKLSSIAANSSVGGRASMGARGDTGWSKVIRP